jgi:hypothetical protein
MPCDYSQVSADLPLDLLFQGLTRFFMTIPDSSRKERDVRIALIPLKISIDLVFDCLVSEGSL